LAKTFRALAKRARRFFSPNFFDPSFTRVFSWLEIVGDSQGHAKLLRCLLHSAKPFHLASGRGGARLVLMFRSGLQFPLPEK
jgi:hypothetical protein